MLKGIKVKIYPNQNQLQQIEQNIGNARFVWNQMLNMWQTRYQNNPSLPTLGKYALNNLLPALKREYPFLKASESTSLQFTCETLHDAFVAFFKRTRKQPKFKAKKTATPAFTVKNNQNIELVSHALKLPKLGWIKARWSNHIPFKKIKRVTITRTASGHYQASVLVESDNQVLDKTAQQIGLDMGQIDLMIGSDGLRVKTQTYKKYETKLKKWQRAMARRQRLAKEKGVALTEAKNYQKAKQMVAKYHAKIRHCRTDYLQKETTKIVKAYDFIAVEDLKVKNMLANPNQNKRMRANHHKIANQSWHHIRTLLAYKCAWHGKTLIKVDPKYTSQRCSVCGHHDGKHALSVRDWRCSACHTHHDRDINAARNILHKALNQVR